MKIRVPAGIQSAPQPRPIQAATPPREPMPVLTADRSNDLLDLLVRKFREGGGDDAPLADFLATSRDYLANTPLRSITFNGGRHQLNFQDGTTAPLVAAHDQAMTHGRPEIIYPVTEPARDRHSGMLAMPVDRTSIQVTGND